MERLKQLNLGYVVSNGGGENRLGVVVRNQPTYSHYDPEQIEVNTFDRDNGTFQKRKFTISSPSLTRAPHVLPGIVTLRDRVPKPVQFFTWGGELKSLQQKDLSIFQVTSSAPIFEIPKSDGFSDIYKNQRDLMNHFLAELGRVRVLFGANDNAFYAKVADVDPLDLYHYASYDLYLQVKWSHVPVNLRLRNYVSRERKWQEAQGIYPRQLVDIIHP